MFHSTITLALLLKQMEVLLIPKKLWLRKPEDQFFASTRPVIIIIFIIVLNNLNLKNYKKDVYTTRM